MTYKLINTDYLQTVSGGDKAIIIELVDLFQDQVAEITNEMRNLYAKGEYFSLGLLAHKAKSSVAIMGMNELAVMLKTFELEGKEGTNSNTYEAYIDRYESDSKEAISELRDYISNI